MNYVHSALFFFSSFQCCCKWETWKIHVNYSSHGLYPRILLTVQNYTAITIASTCVHSVSTDPNHLLAILYPASDYSRIAPNYSNIKLYTPPSPLLSFTTNFKNVLSRDCRVDMYNKPTLCIWLWGLDVALILTSSSVLLHEATVICKDYVAIQTR